MNRSPVWLDSQYLGVLIPAVPDTLELLGMLSERKEMGPKNFMALNMTYSPGSETLPSKVVIYISHLVRALDATTALKRYFGVLLSCECYSRYTNSSIKREIFSLCFLLCPDYR